MQLKIICVIPLLCTAVAHSAVSLRHTRTVASLVTEPRDIVSSPRTVIPVFSSVSSPHTHGYTHNSPATEEEEDGGTWYTDAELKNKFVPKEEHDEKVGKLQEEVVERRQHGHHLFGALFLCLLITLAGAFAMATSSNKILAANTWTTLEGTIVVTIASTLFFVVSHIFHDLTEGSEWGVALHVVYAVAIYLAATFASYSLRNQKVGLAAFDGVIFWVVLLAQGGAITEAQNGLGSSLTDVVCITMASLAALFLLIFVTHCIKPGERWYDGVETSLAGGAFAGGVTTAVGILINGHEHEGENASWQSYEKTVLTNAFAFATCVMAVLLTPVLNKNVETATSYWPGRFWSFLSSFVGVLPYFTVSVGAGALVCNLFQIPPTSMMANLIDAMAGGIVGFAMILVCSLVPFLKGDSERAKALSSLLLGFGGFMAGYGWAGLLSTSIQELVEGHGMGEHTMARAKIGIIVVVNAVLVPIYVMHLKPIIMEKTS